MNWDEIVSSVLAEARRYAGGAPGLSAALDRAGVSPDAGPYSESAISNWVKARTRPPANVLLAAASLADISLDQRIGVTSATAEQPDTAALRDELDELRRKHGRLETLVSDLYGRVGVSFPREPEADERGQAVSE